MAKAFYVVPTPHEQYVPPMEEIQYTDAITGELRGGWWCVGEAPNKYADNKTIILCIDSTPDMLDVFADPALYPDLFYLGDVIEGVI